MLVLLYDYHHPEAFVEVDDEALMIDETPRPRLPLCILPPPPLCKSVRKGEELIHRKEERVCHKKRPIRAWKREEGGVGE